MATAGFLALNVTVIQSTTEVEEEEIGFNNNTVVVVGMGLNLKIHTMQYCALS